MKGFKRDVSYSIILCNKSSARKFEEVCNIKGFQIEKYHFLPLVSVAIINISLV